MIQISQSICIIPGFLFQQINYRMIAVFICNYIKYAIYNSLSPSFICQLYYCIFQYSGKQFKSVFTVDYSSRCCDFIIVAHIIVSDTDSKSFQKHTAYIYVENTLFLFHFTKFQQFVIISYREFKINIHNSEIIKFRWNIIGTYFNVTVIIGYCSVPYLI